MPEFYLSMFFNAILLYLMLIPVTYVFTYFCGVQLHATDIETNQRNPLATILFHPLITIMALPLILKPRSDDEDEVNLN